MMRIISGKARGVKLATLPGDTTRPTAERVKEALFSMLQFEVRHSKVLDLFGGSGQMGLEALSRGADSAYICDREREAVAVIRENVKRTRLEGCTVLQCDWRAALERLQGERFDIIYLDPPYKAGVIPEVLADLVGRDMVAPGGIVVCEDERSEPYTLTGFSLRRHAKYGRIYLSVLEREDD